MTPRVSILTACHNDGATLGSALLSALSQSGVAEQLEVVLVAHGCTDETHFLVNAIAIEDRVRCEVIFDRLSPPAALNHAASLARGEWLVVLNADDLLDVHAVQTILRIANDRPEVNCIFSPWQWIGHRRDMYDFAPYTGDRRMLTEHQIPGIRAVRRDLWRALGGEDESIEIGADWDWAVRASVRGLLEPYKHPTPLWWVRDHGPHVLRLSAQCDHKALRAHMAKHFEAVTC